MTRVLVPRGGAWGERVQAELAAHGAVGVVAPLIASRPPRDVAARDAAFERLAAGEYSWVFVTSAATVEQLLAAGVVVPAATRVAVVGASTARAVRGAGWNVDFTPVAAASARALVTEWLNGRTASTTGKVLVLRSDLAAATVSDELDAHGFAVDVCIAYRTVGVDLDTAVVTDLRAGTIDAVLLTSLSVARELRRQVPTLSPDVVIASIGPATTRDAQSLGMTVAVTTTNQSIEGLVAALAQYLEQHPPRTARLGEYS